MLASRQEDSEPGGQEILIDKTLEDPIYNEDQSILGTSGGGNNSSYLHMIQLS